jgi:M6 family metalloprotease-like protein
MQRFTTIMMACLFILTQVCNLSILKASPAFPYPIEFTQPDGTKITIILKGNEHSKWALTTDGYTLLFNAQGYYEYATINSDNNLVPSGIVAKDVSNRSAADQEFLNKTPKGLTFSESQRSAMRSFSEMAAREYSQKAFPTKGSRKLLCILIGFTDKAISKTSTDFDNLFNQIGYSVGNATGSVKDYYKSTSYNQLDLTVTVAGPYVAANNLNYYGANDTNGDDVRPRDLITEAINKADKDVNFADYDNDGDGVVDGVYVIYAGYGEEAGASANTIWAHAWSITPLTKDGKTVSKYSCSAELRNNSGTSITSIGVICHEFGHVMGAPDYYDVDYGTGGEYIGTGKWDIMADGSWNNNGDTPAGHNPYTKISKYAWATSTELTTAGSYSLADALTNKSFYRINSTTTNEYWLLENRQKSGFDNAIPGHGLLIYHVHKDIGTNAINSTAPQKMYPVCASAATNPGSTPSSYGSINSGGCPFPGTSNKTQFTDSSTPNMKSWAGASTNKPITNITENSGTISFTFMGGSVNTPTANTLAASSISETGATLNAQVNANGYSTSISFEYGATSSYGKTATASPATATGTALTSTSAIVSGLTANTTYHYRVKATNANGTAYGSDKTFITSNTAPTSLKLPITENFTSTSIPEGWTTQNTGTSITQCWSISNTNKAGGSANEAKFSYQKVNPGTARLISPAINTTNVEKINLSFSHLLDDYATGATLRIQTSTDLVNWTNETWSLASKSNTNVGPVVVNTTILNNLNSPNTYIAFVVTGDLYQIDYWYIDNISATDATGSTNIVSYCDAAGSDPSGEWIDLVQLSDMSNTSAAGSGYDNFSSKVANVVAGTTYTLTLSCGFSGSAYTEYFGVWLDANANGTFEDSEKVANLSTRSNGNVTASIVIPTGAITGQTRMRVAMRYSTAPVACGTFNYGEVEDYSVNIKANSSEQKTMELSKDADKEISESEVYPNPVSNYVNIRIKNFDNEAILKFYNNTGTLVKTHIMNSSSETINVSDLPTGLYIITKNGNTIGRFMKE